MREPRLVTTFVDLTDTLVDDFDVIDLLTRLANRCLEVLDVAADGLMLVNPDGELSVAASSSEEMRTLELFEIQSSEISPQLRPSTGSDTTHRATTSFCPTSPKG